MVQGIERRRNNPRKKLIKKKIKVNALESNVQTILPETSDQDQVEANSLNTESQNNKSESSFPKSQDTVILLNRLPHGFLEPQLKTFFSQFGDIKRMRLIRSKKTGNSKGYAFIEYVLPEVASIVAETMNNYIMFGVVIGCRVLPKDCVPQGLFTNYRRYIKRGLNVEKQRLKHNKNEIVVTEMKAYNLVKKFEKSFAKLKELGLPCFPFLSKK